MDNGKFMHVGDYRQAFAAVPVGLLLVLLVLLKADLERRVQFSLHHVLRKSVGANPTAEFNVNEIWERKFVPQFQSGVSPCLLPLGFR